MNIAGDASCLPPLVATLHFTDKQWRVITPRRAPSTPLARSITRCGMRLSDLEVTHAEARVNGVRLQYVIKGKEDAPLVLLLHGFPESWWSWRYQIDPLVEAGYRVLVPDQRGYAKSDKHGPFDLDTLANDMCALVDHVAGKDGKKSALVVGHDWGGAVAWHLASTRPEHCEKLVVMNCPHPIMFQKGLTSSFSQLKKSWYMFFFQLPWLPERTLTKNGAEYVYKIFRACATDRTNFGRDELAPILEGACEPGAAKGMLAWYRQALVSGFRDRLRNKTYATITAPSLLLWATDDIALGFEQLVPGTERYAPKLVVEKIARCGHFVQAEQPEEVNRRLLAFLAR